MASLKTILPLAGVAGVWYQFPKLSAAVKQTVPGLSNELANVVVILTTAVLLGAALYKELETPLVFIWNCFFKPIGKHNGEQSDRLDAFYQGQASIYDATRGGLLQGRTTMLKLIASHLREQDKAAGSAKPSKRVWVDIGGGTGWNIENMASYMDIENDFEHIYLIDLCEPLLEVARKRFAARGWKNVTCLKQDASQFVLPEWEKGVDPRASVNVVTLSYSLSMIPTFYPLLDRVEKVLEPTQGLVGVVDFYTSKDAGTAHERAIGSAKRKVGWFSRWFWQIWFDFDHVNLHPARRDYLEYKFGTIKSYNGRNNFIIPYLVQIPYYIFVGTSRSRDVSFQQKAFEGEIGNVVGTQTPLLTPGTHPMEMGDHVPHLNIGSSVVQAKTKNTEMIKVDMGAPLSAFHYQTGGATRVPYRESTVHNQFRTHIYGFTWECPREDMTFLNLTPDDSMLVITSAGDNALHYAIAGGPKRIHTVDMNPCQGHILELKLAAVRALTYDEYWACFGIGKVANFRELLDTKLAPYLSSHAYQYWRINESYFKDFHYKGYSGHALRLAHYAFWLAGRSGDIQRMCSTKDLAEQNKIWVQKIRPVMLNPLITSIINSPFFLWNALGVPRNQFNVLLKDGSMKEFIDATLDPVPRLEVMSTGAYHYLLCLTGKYTKESCPLYLTREGYDTLRRDAFRIDSFRLHTDTIINVLRGLGSSSLTRVIVMDSMDWFTEFPASTPLPTKGDVALDLLDETPEAKYESLKSELDYQVLEVRRVLAVGGFIVWRSAGKHPWYNQRFELAGFKVEPIAIRENGQAIDRVNMYASCWKATKMREYND